MSFHGPVIGEFGSGRVVFIDGEQRIPGDLLTEFLAMVDAEPEPAMLRSWERRLEASIGVTDIHRRLAATGLRPGQRWFHGLSRDLLRACFAEYFGLAAEYVEILIVLYERPGEKVPTKKLRHLLNSHRPPKHQAVYERMRVLREVMEPESIDSGGQLNPDGYRLTEVGYSDCGNALAHMADVLAKHGEQAGRVLGEQHLLEERRMPLQLEDQRDA